MADSDNTLYIVDGSAEMWRAHFSRRNLSTTKGFPTSSLFGFAQILRSLLDRHKPRYLAIAFDASRQSFRNTLYPEYKANRSAPPDDLVVQMPRVRDLVRAFNIPVLEQEGVEADDLIATLTRLGREAGLPVVVVSPDKDLMQLIDDAHPVRVFNPRKDVFVNEADVVERFQVQPNRVSHVMALAGDSSDNVPGVPGIGEKTGGKLIAEFGDLETLLSSTDKVSGKKRRQNLIDFADQARLSLELVTLKDDIDMALDLEALKVGEPDFEALAALYEEFEFYSLLGPLRTRAENADVALDIEPEPDKSYRGVFTEADLEATVRRIRASGGPLAVDLETTDLNTQKALIVGVSLAWDDHAGVYIPCDHRYIGAPKQLPLEQVLDALKPLLEDEALPLVGQNLKYDWLILQRYGIDLKGVVNDTMLASYVLDPSKQSHSLDTLSLEVLRYRTIPFEEVAGKGRNKRTFDQVEVERAIDYAAEDADVTRLLHLVFTAQLADHPELASVLNTIELPLWRVLARMEQTGVLVDPTILKTLHDEFGAELRDLETQIHGHAGKTFNIDSPSQLAQVLFEDLGLPVIKRTKTGPSTAQSVLEELKDQNPIPALILEYRSFAKLKSTYVDALPELIADDGRIHTHFNQAVAATGRLSSSNPNLQNIPIRTKRGRAIRKAFIAPEGWTLLTADYSQIELRILAHLSQDPALTDAFNNGQDIHQRTAAEIFEIPQDQVTSDQRRAGKTINFGVIYGMGAGRLARDLDIPYEQAQDYIDAYFDRYTGVRDYFESLLTEARSTGYATTHFGRRRPVPELRSSKGHLRALGERLAINTPIQGTAADIIKLAMIQMQDRIDHHPWHARMLLQVHDELVFEVRDDQLADFTQAVVEVMTGAIDLNIPLLVDVGTGKTWFEAK